MIQGKKLIILQDEGYLKSLTGKNKVSYQELIQSDTITILDVEARTNAIKNPCLLTKSLFG